MTKLLFLVASYLFSAIPFGLLIGRLFFNKDIRKEGSGNIGATNVIRTCGKKAGILTFLLDGLKGALPALMAKLYFAGNFYYLVGIICVIGHTFPIYLNFKGGKGVATAFLTFLIINPFLALIMFCIWLIFLGAFGYVSLASIASAIFLLPASIFIHGIMPVIFNLLIACIIIVKHSSNIKNLLNKDEKRMFKKPLSSFFS